MSFRVHRPGVLCLFSNLIINCYILWASFIKRCICFCPLSALPPFYFTRCLADPLEDIIIIWHCLCVCTVWICVCLQKPLIATNSNIIPSVVDAVWKIHSRRFRNSCTGQDRPKPVWWMQTQDPGYFSVWRPEPWAQSDGQMVHLRRHQTNHAVPLVKVFQINGWPWARPWSLLLPITLLMAGVLTQINWVTMLVWEKKTPRAKSLCDHRIAKLFAKFNWFEMKYACYSVYDLCHVKSL